MATGTVKWFNHAKAYGFITPTTGERDIFVHVSAVHRAGLGAINEGQRLQFDVEVQQSGRKTAINLIALTTR